MYWGRCRRFRSREAPRTNERPLPPIVRGQDGCADRALALLGARARLGSEPKLLTRIHECGVLDTAIASARRAPPTDRRGVGSVRVLRIHARVVRVQVEVLLARTTAGLGDRRSGGVDPELLEDPASQRTAGDERGHLAPARSQKMQNFRLENPLTYRDRPTSPRNARSRLAQVLWQRLVSVDGMSDTAVDKGRGG
jgi:hypothetical protein